MEDDARFPRVEVIKFISIHVLRVEDDTAIIIDIHLLSKFQSTSSVWRTTNEVIEMSHISIISIHVLRVEDDK